MRLASDFSVLGRAVLVVLLGLIVFYLAAGAMTAGLIRLWAKKGRFWVMAPLCTIGWVAVSGLGWWLYELWTNVPIPAQRPAAAKVAELGGHVQMNAQHQIEGVSLNNARVTDSTLKLLAELPDLLTLRLSNSSITDEALPHLSSHKQLRSLHLDKTRISDAGLQHLKEFKNLKVLDLSGTQVTDDVLEQLYELHALENLWLRDTKVTDNVRLGLMFCLPNLRMLDQMRSSRTSMGVQLELQGAKITNVGFQMLGKMEHLVYLNLAETPVTDADLELLTDLTLISLDLRHTKVTDAGLVFLEAIPTLSYLHLDDTSVTPEGIAKLSEKLPRCAFPR